jgi:putative acetyltransferase
VTPESAAETRSDAQIVPYAPRWREDAIAVVRAVFDEYGFTWDADEYHRDLYTIDEHYLATGGGFWLLVAAGRGLGTVAALDRGDGVVEGERLYLRAERRGRGDGERLLRHVVDWSRRRGFRRFVGWSDKRFAEAHELYAKLGMARFGERICDDPDHSPEWGYELDLTDPA